MAGYHQADIPKGFIGTFSKIKEEFLEAEDANNQESKIMLLVELSDLVGAIELFLEHEYHGAINLQDLCRFKDITRHVFEAGHRT